MIDAKIRLGERPARELRLVDQNLQPTRQPIDPDHVTVAKLADGAAAGGLRRHMQRRRGLAGSARQPPVRHQRDLETSILQDAQRRHQLVQLRHAVGARALEAHDDDDVAVQFAGAKRLLHFLLRLEHPRGRLDHHARRRKRARLDDGAAQRPLQHAQPARRRKRRRRAAQHALVAALFRRGLERHGAVFEPGLDHVIGEALAPDGARVAVQQARAQQFADQHRHAARRLKMVHVGLAVGINARQQRRHLGQIGEIVPCQRNARRRRHRDHVDGEVGRAARRMQADDAVHHRALVDDMADGRVGIALGRQLQHTFGGQNRQRLAQRRVGVDEGRAWQMQAHDLHQHLVGVGGAVERAGPRRMVGFGLSLQQIGAARLALRVKLSDVGLLVVREARRHRPRRHEHRRQMAERQRADQQPRHDLVAHAQIHRSVEHLVRQRNRRRHGDDVAREQRQVHARLALGDAVAHRGHATRDLRRRAHRAGGALDDLGVGLVGLMRRKHVVIGGDDGEIGRVAVLERRLVARRAGREAVGEIGAAQSLSGRAGRGRLLDALKIGRTMRVAALDEARGDFADPGLHGHQVSSRYDFRHIGRNRGFRQREALGAGPRAPRLTISPAYIEGGGRA